MGINEEKYKAERRRLLQYVKEYAAKNGLTQEEIAEKTGFTQNNISRMLMGRYSPTLDNLIRLTEVIDHEVVLTKRSDPQISNDDEIEPKFMFTVDPVNNEVYILHRHLPACLIHIKQETPVRFIIIDLYDDVENPANLLNMPFVEEAKAFFRQYGESILPQN